MYLMITHDPKLFQSTLPLRGATKDRMPKIAESYISIHAPLTGSDAEAESESKGTHNFNPRSPYGERPVNSVFPVKPPQISIHAPLTGSDPSQSFRPPKAGYFNPRSPYGERPACVRAVRYQDYFNPRSPYGERLFENFAFVSGAGISIHAPLTGSDELQP